MARAQRDDQPTVISELMAARGVTADWLAGRSRELFPRFPVSKSTINNWRRGTSQVAQDWRSVAVLAQLLDLDLDAADELLASLGCLTVSHRMRVDSNDGDIDLLARWACSNDARFDQSATNEASVAVANARRLILATAAEAECTGRHDMALNLYKCALEMSRTAGLVDVALAALSRSKREG